MSYLWRPHPQHLKTAALKCKKRKSFTTWSPIGNKQPTYRKWKTFVSVSGCIWILHRPQREGPACIFSWCLSKRDKSLFQPFGVLNLRWIPTPFSPAANRLSRCKRQTAAMPTPLINRPLEWPFPSPIFGGCVSGGLIEYHIEIPAHTRRDRHRVVNWKEAMSDFRQISLLDQQNAKQKGQFQKKRTKIS